VGVSKAGFCRYALIAAWEGGGRAMAAWQASASREVAAEAPSLQLGTLPQLEPAHGEARSSPQPASSPPPAAPGQGPTPRGCSSCERGSASPMPNFTCHRVTQPVATLHTQLGYFISRVASYPLQIVHPQGSRLLNQG